MIQKIQKKLVSASYTQAELLGWFKAIGNIREIGEGVLKHTVTKIEKMEPGEIIVDLSAVPTNEVRFVDQTTNLLTLAAKIAIPVMTLDAYKNNDQIDVGLNDIIETQLKAFVEQIDQFLAYGDSFLTPHTGDKNAGEGFSVGIFNGGTPFAAGDGKDNIMNAAGDYQSTVANALLALENAGFKQQKNYMFSDNTTYHTAELGVHQLNTIDFVNERMAIDKNPRITSWVFSKNFTDGSATKRIVITTPWINEVPRAEIGPIDRKSTFAYRLLQGYNLKVMPLYGGGIGPTGRYEFYILWSGALEFLRTGAIQSSGSLTL
jgi:hypothetical protein